MTDEKTLIFLGTLSHPYGPESPSAVLPPGRATPTIDRIAPVTEFLTCM